MQIKKASIPEIVAFSRHIPEFKQPYTAAIYEKRLNNRPHLLLLAQKNGQIVGFKVGYERIGHKGFYSWMGGVLPSHRRTGIAQALANYQEQWVKERAYTSIWLKTRNCYKGMLLFALKNGYDIIDLEQKENVKNNRIILEKILTMC